MNSLKQHKKGLIAVGSTLGGILLLYIGFVIYFSSHFYWGTQINSLPVGGKSIAEAELLLKEGAKEYCLTLKEKYDITETLSGEAFGYEYVLGDQVNALKKEQGAWRWLWKGSSCDYKVKIIYHYDKELLKDKVDELACFKTENIVAPKEPQLVYNYFTYEVRPGETGNEVDKIQLYQTIVETIKEGKIEIILEEKDCYRVPVYKMDVRKLERIKENLNHYLGATIVYEFQDRQEIVGSEVINKWLTYDEEGNVLLDERMVHTYVEHLASRFDTLGSSREFVTTGKTKAVVNGGDYGWEIDVEAETQALIEQIKAGMEVKREPIYSHSAYCRATNDIGNTYVEINLTKQYLWFYHEGNLVAEGDVVTGDLRRKMGTPEGTYNLDFMRRNAILRGSGYACPVSFWMPFNGGIGIHDATWRGKFGGEIYKTDGSHGCINASYQLAEAIFEQIEVGVPIVCYFE